MQKYVSHVMQTLDLSWQGYILLKRTLGVNISRDLQSTLYVMQDRVF